VSLAADKNGRARITGCRSGEARSEIFLTIVGILAGKSQPGGKSGKKPAIIAVACKLVALLHHLWISCEEYEPLHNARKRRLKAA
jgi:hypothetical protein